MAGSDVKIHAYKISKAEPSQDLEAVLQTISRDDIPNRERSVHKADVRVEDIEQLDQDTWLMDFVLRRFEGPGRSPANQAISDFNMAEDERFGEETAGLYHVPSQHLLLQYNHRGVKLGRILEYFSSYDATAANAFDGLFELDPSWRARLKRLKIPRAIDAAVAPGYLTEQDRASNIAARHAAALSDHSGANHVRIELAAQGYSNQRLNQLVFKLREGLLLMASRNPDSVKKLTYRGKPSPDEAAEALDLLECRLQKVIANVGIGIGRRIERPHRYNALRRTWTSWEKLLVP